MAFSARFESGLLKKAQLVYSEVTRPGIRVGAPFPQAALAAHLVLAQAQELIMPISVDSVVPVLSLMLCV